MSTSALTPDLSTADPVAEAIAPASTNHPKPERESFLSTVGGILRKSLHVGEAVASLAEPVVTQKVPEVGGIYHSAIQLAVNAEATVTSAMGSGTQKLSQVTASLVPQAQTWAKSNGIEWHDAEITKWSSAVVDTLNMIPAPKAQTSV